MLYFFPLFLSLRFRKICISPPSFLHHWDPVSLHIWEPQLILSEHEHRYLPTIVTLSTVVLSKPSDITIFQIELWDLATLQNVQYFSAVDDASTTDCWRHLLSGVLWSRIYLLSSFQNIFLFLWNRQLHVKDTTFCPIVFSLCFSFNSLLKKKEKKKSLWVNFSMSLDCMHV